MREENVKKFKEFIEENGLEVFIDVIYDLCKEREDEIERVYEKLNKVYDRLEKGE